MVHDYRSVSFWMETSGGDLAPRPSLDGDIDADVAIVGAGYTGLWTAYYLARARPELRIVVLEKEIAGFGASGRNGGWCSALFAASREKIAKRHGRGAAVAMQKAMFATVDEVGRTLSEEGIDAAFTKGGTLVAARGAAQESRLRQHLATERSWGLTEEDVGWLDQTEARRRIEVTDCRGALYTPHCAVVHPARLVRGLPIVSRLEE